MKKSECLDLEQKPKDMLPSCVLENDQLLLALFILYRCPEFERADWKLGLEPVQERYKRSIIELM